jgi:hypothetical protein
MIFSHKINITSSDLLICVGVKKGKQIADWLNKYGTKEAKKLLTPEIIKELDESLTGKLNAFLYVLEQEDANFYFICLKEFKNKWECFETLLHEIIHYKQFQWRDMRIRDEIEFEAYFVEHCFRSLRKELFKRLKL